MASKSVGMLLTAKTLKSQEKLLAACWVLQMVACGIDFWWSEELLKV